LTAPEQPVRHRLSMILAAAIRFRLSGPRSSTPCLARRVAAGNLSGRWLEL
jgi:hypothetical protein